MQAVILAAGKGKRFGETTKIVPKCLIKVSKRPLIFYILNSIPEDVSSIIIVVNHLSEKIKSVVGKKFNNIPVFYVDSKKINGTAGALWDAKKFLKEDFLVLNGDDIIPKKEIKKIAKYPLSFGISKHFPLSALFLNVKVEKGFIKSLERIKNTNKQINVATGTYKLNKDIFKYSPVHIKNGEFGLPQTIMKMAKKYPIKACFVKSWIPINNHKELHEAEKKLKSKKNL